MFTLSKSNYFVCELLDVSYETTVLCALRPSWKLEPCLPVFKVRYRGKLISSDFWIVSMRLEGTFEILPSFSTNFLSRNMFWYWNVSFGLKWVFPWRGEEGVFLGIRGGGVPPGTPNSDIMGLFLIQFEPIDKYVHTPPRSLENYTRFQTKMGKVYTCFQTDSKSFWGGTYRYHGLYKGVYNR